MANVNIKSYNEVLGDMIRKIIADTPINDINTGSVILTLLEAAAANDFENNTAVLNVLELLNIDSIRNNDLDAYASNLGLTRNTAVKASGNIVITDSSITKRSTTLYPIKPAPIAGTNVLYINDATGWNQNGQIYIGRGTPNFEGPINYSSIVDNGSFYTINLDSSLEKDHLLSEEVVDGQETSDRIIEAGTIVKVPSNNITPEIKYTILRTSVIPAGEDTSQDIPIVAVQAGSQGNAGIDTITLFNTIPFSGATVTNVNAFTNGRDTENDSKFRDRIKAYSSTLARGTRRSILSAIDGVSDEVEGKQVASAVITEPAKISDPSIIYLDDGSGFEPSYTGQSVDLMVAEASGNEEFLQLANYPLPRPQVVNTEDAPFLLLDGMELKVEVDGIEEAVVFSEDDFRSISSASLSEVVVVINDKAETFKARFDQDSTRILLYPINHEAETIKVGGDGGSLDANSVIKFPTNEFSYIKLYQNSKLLREVEKSANLTSNPYTTWDIIGTGNLIISVDNTPDQDVSFTTSDFGGANFNTLTLQDYVDVFNLKYAGLTASATTTGRLIITSNREGSASAIEVVGGSYIEKMFGGQPVSSVGQDSDFSLNRQNGNIQLKTEIQQGDIISAGSSDTKGAAISLPALGGNYNVAADANNRPAEMVIVVDGERVLKRSLNLAVGTTIEITDEGSNVMRVTSSTSAAFRNISPGDFLYIANRGDTGGSGTGSWLDIASCGLFKIEAKGEHLNDGVDTYVEVVNVNMVAGGPYSVQDGLDIQAFYSDKYPQIWRGSSVATPASSPIGDVIKSLNKNISGIIAKVFRTNFIKLTSSTEEGGSISIPVSIGSLTQLFAPTDEQQEGTQSHIANRVTETDAFTIFQRTQPTNENVWLDRYTYTDVKGKLTADEEPSKDGTATYSEELQDTTSSHFESDVSYNNSVNITSGQNKQQTRNIRTIIDTDNIGTRNNTPRSLMDYKVDDEYQIIKNLEFSDEDSLVTIIDGDATAKTVDMSFSRTARINSGSQSNIFLPTNVAFSADDAENEDNVDFGSLAVWGTLESQSNTNFNDYKVWFRARNWYTSNGANLIIRAKEYGPIGDRIRFSFEYPALTDQSSKLIHTNTPEYTQATYIFGSGSNIDMGLIAGGQFTVEDLGSNNFRLTFPISANTNPLAVGSILNIGSDTGFSAGNTGVFRVNAKNDTNKTVDIYNPSGVETIVGNAAIHSITCVADVADSLDGTYIIIPTPSGDTVKFWFDNNDSGTIEPDIGITTRSIEVNVTTGDSAITVATTLAAAIITDPAFATASNGAGTLDTITVTNANEGPSLQGSDGTPATSFSFSLITAGISSTYETLNIPESMIGYPLAENDTATIIEKINESKILIAVEETSGTIIKATREESAVVVNELAYNHDPDPLSGLNEFISLHDSENWVLDFQNLNPNFQLKVPMILTGVSPSYTIDTTPNDDGEQGEYFKLIPCTLENTRHHMTHRALSQLDIISDISITNCNKKIQLKSDLLGSTGSIEVVGGRANSAEFKIIGDSEAVEFGGNNYLQMKIPSAPNTLSPGQHVTLQNDAGAERYKSYDDSDSMDVVKINDETYEYRYNKKTTYFNEFTEITIVDANSVDPISYPNPNLVWRWYHDDSGSYAVLLDNALGTVANQPSSYSASGTLGGATNTHISINDPGSLTTKLDFAITMSGQPVQADYITFENSAGSTWAAWFNIDGAGSLPTGGTYISATNKIQVDISSSDTPNQIISILISTLLTNGIVSAFDASLTSGASLTNVKAGDLVTARGILSGWNNTNTGYEFGDDKIAGSPIVNVDSTGKFFDTVNPNGIAMATTAIGSNSEVIISPSPIIEWRLSHSSKIEIDSVNISTGTATATTKVPHNLNAGDTFDVYDMDSDIEPSVPGAGVGTVTSVINSYQFTYTTAGADVLNFAPAGFLSKTGDAITKYKIESLGYNNMYRLAYVSGNSPMFASCGVAVDDLMLLSGSTFESINSGEFRVLGVDDESIIYQNINAIEELNTLVKFNNLDLSANWVANAEEITGIAGTFANLNIGDWIKKTTDDDTFYVQISGFNDSPELATIVTLANAYRGISATAPGHALDQNSSIGTGIELRSPNDIRFLEGDSVRVGDELFITENALPGWFDKNNTGTRTIDAYGTDFGDGRLFLRVTNLAGIAETDVDLGLSNTKLAIVESVSNKFTTIRQIAHIAIDEFNQDRRIVYLYPGNKAYKWSQSNTSSISALGKLKYNTDITTGIDGYLYYTGLLRKVQRIVDGFEPDPLNYPGRKAVGSLIEILPPLPRRVSIDIDVTTQDGVNLSEITNEITSAIINHVSNLGVGEDVILSDIIVRVKNIDGVAAVTFITPSPSEERIPISSDEKAFIESGDISIA
jgi:uncharacterized phage protein gp47/JayE